MIHLMDAKLHVASSFYSLSLTTCEFQRWIYNIHLNDYILGQHAQHDLVTTLTLKKIGYDSSTENNDVNINGCRN